MGIGVIQQAPTGSCWAFTTAVSPGYGLSTAAFHPSPVSSMWTAGTSMGKTRGGHSVYECHCQREEKTRLGLEQGQPLRPAPKPKEYMMHARDQQSPLPLTCSIWEPWLSAERLRRPQLQWLPSLWQAYFAPFTAAAGGGDKSRARAEERLTCRLFPSLRAPVLGLLNRKRQHRAVTPPVLQALHCHRNFSHPQTPHFGCNSVVTVTCMPAMRTGSWGTLNMRNVSLGMME